MNPNNNRPLQGTTLQLHLDQTPGFHDHGVDWRAEAWRLHQELEALREVAREIAADPAVRKASWVERLRALLERETTG